MKNSIATLILSILIFFISVLAFTACDEDCYDETNPLCENYNPCSVTDTETSAEFKMYECINCNWEDTLMRETDTVFGGYVVFRANEFDDIISYEWKVGTDTRVFDTKEFRLDFSDFNGTVEVRLIIHKSINLDCFPDDDGIDTMTKYLTILDYSIDKEKRASFYNKEYEGYNTDEPDSIFTVSFKPINPSEPLSASTINNLPKECIRPDDWKISLTVGYNAFRINNLLGQHFYDCGHIIGYGDILSDRKTIIINYKLTNNALTPFEDRTSKTFIGTLKE